jgi:hypothetical protein
MVPHCRFADRVLRAQGLSYLGCFVEEFGVVLAVGLLLLVFLPARDHAQSKWGPRAARLRRLRWILPMVGVVCLLWYASNQVVLAERAMQLSEPRRKTFGIEPLGWTANCARQWAATGRWIHALAKPGDILAVGAAGAIPSYAQLPNIDTFGLCDVYVARHGTVIGSRPGHQRFASIEYLLRRAPTFLLVNDYATDDPESFRREPSWEQLGYLWVEAEIRPDIHRAPSAFFHYMLVRRDRATELRGHPWTRVADQGSF